MWTGRFSQPTSQLVQSYGESVSFDWRLYAHDVLGSIAQSKALLAAGILNAEEQIAIARGLLEIKTEIDAGSFVWKQTLEDVHMNIEAELTKRIGPAGAKLHTARSRNDQVALDVRLYCRAEIDAIVGLLRAMQRALVECAERNQAAIMPGYTHLQRGEMLDRDAARLTDARVRVNVMPLGYGALAGSTILLDRELIARELDFPAITQNSMDAVSDRDFVAEILFGIALCGVHLSRLSEDIILWASAEFGFVALSDAHTTGSSLMPQKKNPDVAELTRGKTGRLVGNLMALLTLLKGLPMTYNRDMQEDKEPLFDSIDTLKAALAVFAEMISGMEVRAERTRAAACDPMLLATDLADYLVKHGVPFRQAHEIIGKLVAYSLAEGRPFGEMALTEYQQFWAGFDASLYDCLRLETALNARQNPGAPSPANVAAQLQRWRETLS